MYYCLCPETFPDELPLFDEPFPFNSDLPSDVLLPALDAFGVLLLLWAESVLLFVALLMLSEGLDERWLARVLL